MSSKIIAFATSFVSFILPKLSKIEEIILFGSVARGEEDKNSDIDLFFSIKKDQNEDELRRLIERELSRFYKSKLAEQWTIQGIKNPISFKIGVLNEWKLKRSIISEGIVLYGRYKEVPSGQKHYLIFALNPIKNIVKRNLVMRKIFGRKEKNFIKQGIIQEIKGKKLSPNVFIVPIEDSKGIIKILSANRVSYKLFEIWSDQI